MLPSFGSLGSLEAKLNSNMLRRPRLLNEGVAIKKLRLRIYHLAFIDSIPNLRHPDEKLSLRERQMQILTSSRDEVEQQFLEDY